MQIIKKIFLSSSGNGSMSKMWQGLLIIGILSLFPDTDEGTALALADQILLALSGGYALYGGILKLYRQRWSKV